MDCPLELFNEETVSGFILDDGMKANWALKKIAEYNRAYDEYIASYEAEIARVKKQREYACGTLKSMLRKYFDTLPLRATKTQAVHRLPSGRLVLKFAKRTFEHDDKALIEALAGTEYVEQVPKLLWGEYKKRLKIANGRAMDAETGEIIEGVTVVEKPESFTVEAG